MKVKNKVKLIDAYKLKEIVLKWKKQEEDNDNTITGPAIIMAFEDVLEAIDNASPVYIEYEEDVECGDNG